MAANFWLCWVGWVEHRMEVSGENFWRLKKKEVLHLWAQIKVQNPVCEIMLPKNSWRNIPCMCEKDLRTQIQFADTIFKRFLGKHEFPTSVCDTEDISMHLSTYFLFSLWQGKLHEYSSESTTWFAYTSCSMQQLEESSGFRTWRNTSQSGSTLLMNHKIHKIVCYHVKRKFTTVLESVASWLASQKVCHFGMLKNVFSVVSLTLEWRVHSLYSFIA